MTRLAANLPETANGLDAISDELLTAPLEERIVVGIIHCPNAKEDFVNGRHIPYVAFRAIEPLTGKPATDARKLLEKAYVTRTGQESLTLDELDGDHDSEA